MPQSIEIIHAPEKHSFRYAVLDFDGTISLIREGWQQIMVPYFADELCATPGGQRIPREDLELRAREFITQLTGKQTIYQCIRLAEEIRELGGTPLDPQAYKDEYHRRLLERIDGRLRGLESGEIDPALLEGIIASVRQTTGCREVHHARAGATISSHCGPGCLGVLFIED